MTVDDATRERVQFERIVLEYVQGQHGPGTPTEALYGLAIRRIEMLLKGQTPDHRAAPQLIDNELKPLGDPAALIAAWYGPEPTP